MKKLILLVSIALLFVIVGCSNEPAELDYTTEEFEKALNDEEDPVGKTVLVKVDDFVPDSAFGYNMQAGEHLNFVSNRNPNVKAGEEVLVKVEEIQSTLGSYLITHKKQ